MMETDTLQGLEQQLQRSLHPVKPDPKFVNQLEKRLTVPPAITIEYASQMRALLAVGVGVFSGALLFWLLHRFWLWVRKA